MTKIKKKKQNEQKQLKLDAQIVRRKRLVDSAQ